MELFAGIDLGKRKSQIKVITSERKVLEELKIENDPKSFERVFKKYKGNIEVACEASSNAFWVADVLAPLVRKVHVGHTSKIRLIAEAQIKTDELDAGILAELLRADLFPEIWIPPQADPGASRAGPGAHPNASERRSLPEPGARALRPSRSRL